ncbi:MAG: hypothetical protein RR288_06990 [Oscillibacter sp.]
MLRKLMKHEFRATARIMGPLYLVLLLTAVGGNFALRVMDHSQSQVLNALAGLLMFAFVFAIMGVCIMSLVLMIQRFYKNLMGDEGYVMFTLPVSVHQQVWSKLIVSSVWFIATGAAVILAALIMSFDVSLVGYTWDVIQEILGQITAYYALNGTAIFLELLVLIFVSCAAACLQFYAAMAVGHSFANHKGLWSVGVFFVSQFALQFLGSILLIALDFTNFSFDWITSGMLAVHVVMVGSSLFMALYGALFYGVTTFTLKRHLNLE